MSSSTSVNVARSVALAHKPTSEDSHNCIIFEGEKIAKAIERTKYCVKLSWLPLCVRKHTPTDSVCCSAGPPSSLVASLNYLPCTWHCSYAVLT